MLEVRLLGTFEVTYKNRISIASRPAQSLFAYLILNAGTTQRREKLAGMLWPDSLEETARDNLRHALWRIRKALPSQPTVEYLLTDDLSIAFNASADYWLDAASLEKLNDGASADELLSTLSEYHGELLPGFYDEWVVSEREHLASIFEHHMARLMSLLEKENRFLEILDWAERWIKLGQKPEPAYRALMTAHGAKGDMSKVAATYERCTKSLKEFGIAPSEQTRALYEKLKAGKEKIGAGTTIPEVVKRIEIPGTNVPVPLTSFVGREKEVEEIIKMLGKKRLVTLMGAGGMGKTRLAIQASNKLIGKFKDGIWWVELVGLNDPALIKQEIAKVLDVREVSNRPITDALVEHLQKRHVLLVLDNCEHLIVGCAQLVDLLLSSCKNLKILATSREALDILSETIWTVPSLALPNLGENLSAQRLKKYESIHLFTERAEGIQPQFRLTDQNTRAVAQICHRLSGMPLAIELAAARVKMMSVDEISKRLDDRFSLLTSGSRNSVPRHQTLRAAIDWSYELLTEPEQLLFSRLAIFAGGFSLDAAEVVCGFGELKRNDVLDLVGRLVDKSLVVAEVASPTGASRYRLLETIRQYAQERLNGSHGTAVRDHHLEFYVRMAEEAEAQLELLNQAAWLDQLEAEIDNLRAAIDWSLASAQIIFALRMVGALRRFWLIRSHDGEGLERIKTILDHPDAIQPTSARLKAMNAYFFILWPHGKLNEAQLLVEDAIELGATLGDQREEAFALLWAGVSATEQGAYPRARLNLEQSREKWGDDGRSADLALSLVFLGEIAMFEQDVTRAEGFFETAVSPFKDVKDYPFVGMVVRRLGQLALKRNQLDRSIALIRESLVHNWEVHDYRGVGACLAALGAVNMAQRKKDRAAKLFGVVDSFIESTQIPLLPFDQHEYERNVSQLRTQLKPTDFEKAWLNGRSASMDQTVGSVLEEFG
jgi:predicted ATPase/DNA-binding SARP family transcriptional activator